MFMIVFQSQKISNKTDLVDTEIWTKYDFEISSLQWSNTNDIQWFQNE